MLAIFAFMQNFLADRVRRDDRGATAVEYGLIVTVIALVMVVGAALLGDALSALFSDIADSL
jgi:pilus assembly protein Flp/PilA